MKILIWVKEENLSRLNQWIKKYNNSIPNENPPSFLTRDIISNWNYISVMIDYETYQALKDYEKN
jgi:hypothetical protein